MQANNEDTSRASVFIKTRSKKDGTIPDDDTRNLVARMNEKINEVAVEEQTQAYKEQVFVDLMGPDRHGRVRTFGSGPAPRDVFGSRPSSSHSNDIDKLVDAKVDAKVAVIVDAKVAEIKSDFEKTQTELLEKMARMQNLLEVYGIRPSSSRPDGNGSGSSVGQQVIRTNSNGNLR